MKSSKYILFIALLGICIGCSLTKDLQEGQYAVYENKIEGIDQSDKDELYGLIEQEPNTRFLGSSLGVTIYRVGRNFYDSTEVAARLERTEESLAEVRQARDSLPDDKKLRKKQDKLNAKTESLEKKLEYGNAVMRTGNPLVVLDSAETETTVENLKGYLVNHGFFESSVDFSVETKKKKAFVTYQITEGPVYVLDSIYTRSDNPEIIKLLKQRPKDSHIKVGEYYVQDNIVMERNRIEELLKNNGFFMFSKSYINYIAYQDTAAKTINLEQIIQKPTFSDKHEVYTIDSITFRINPPSNEFADRRVQETFRDIDFSFYRDRYSAKVLASRIFLKTGQPYSRTAAIETQRQLSNLDLFRFVNITFDTLGTSLTAHIFTQPNQKYQLTNQLGMTITEQLPGPFFSTSLRNRNFFRAGEILEFNFRAGLEGVASATGQGVYQSSEVSTGVTVIFPRFLIPFAPGSLQKYGRYNPNTRTRLSYIYTNRPEYTRNAVNGLLSYTWATSTNRIHYTLNAADISYIRTPKIQDEFLDILEDLQNEGNNLIWSFLPSFISSISGQTVINFNKYGDFTSNKASLLRLFAESGGTTLNFFDVRSNSEPGIDYANFQWVKTQADFRRYYPIDQNQQVAYRLNFGWARPYGVSAGILPYEKYFFAGGGTSIRAWQARRLGPGSFSPETGEGGEYDYTNEQPAEMILESMLEYRRKLFGYFDMALFVDIGNSWVIGYDSARPGADFRYDRFYKELAVGTGLGLRMDFDFLVIRLDLATKAVDPAKPEGERWVLDNINFKRPFGVRGQTVLNFGIGYPF
ncbi:BamA/TamA family outer membrane protein [Algoriphagus sp. H41]|uniref:BamA/TamA family outer membrane protein n=1 Tax=Algoriphagus oliviformis TaxID=2811231 RepID=A0ABS3CB32_9BACT|nr:BamA/TamA family outer membrane protein [Algoriphagus oliviformis]MBN7812844.1 BamA/TamA family outer membrane protein [Algoriphagus oliviformis]